MARIGRATGSVFAVWGILAGLFGVAVALVAVVLGRDLGWVPRAGGLTLGLFGITYLLAARGDWAERRR